MAASSVTGTGYGSAEDYNRGRKENHIGVERLIGPRVVAAGSATLTTGAATVVLPLLPGAVTDYVVMVTDATAAAACKGVLTFNTNDTTITLAGTSSDVLQWAIISVGPANKP